MNPARSGAHRGDGAETPGRITEPVMNSFLKENQHFKTFGRQHRVMLGLTAALTVLLPWVGCRYLTPGQQIWLARAMSVILSLAVVLWMAFRARLRVFDHTTDLPFDYCNLTALLMPVLLWEPHREIHEILYFWILTGTLLAMVTPYLSDGFPHYTFFKYWLVHGGLVVLLVYNTVVFGLYPEWTGIFRAFGWLHGYAAVMFLINRQLGSNYLYLRKKPPIPTLLDYFGPWPWYLFVCWVLAFVLFGLVYVPVWLLR